MKITQEPKKVVIQFEDLPFGTVFKVSSGEVMLKTGDNKYFILTNCGGITDFLEISEAWSYPVTEVYGKIKEIIVEPI